MNEDYLSYCKMAAESLEGHCLMWEGVKNSPSQTITEQPPTTEQDYAVNEDTGGILGDKPWSYFIETETSKAYYLTFRTVCGAAVSLWFPKKAVRLTTKYMRVERWFQKAFEDNLEEKLQDD